jgi:hypothetical protein
MRKMMMIALCVLVFASVALAQESPYTGGNIQAGATPAGNNAPPAAVGATVGTPPAYNASNWDPTVTRKAGAQFPSWFGAVDKLGAHQNGGKGCVGCHAPHSGGAGNGGSATNTFTAGSPGTWSQPVDTTNNGNDRLWGQDLGPLYNASLTGQNYTQWIPGGIDSAKKLVDGVTANPNYNTWQLADGLGNKLYTNGTVAGGTPAIGTASSLITITASNPGVYSLPGVNQFVSRSAEVTGIMMCLSCHDGNIAQGAMMTNQSYEQKMGLLPANAYGPAAIPTLLGNDGTAAGNYGNDHPIGPDANLGAVGVANNFTLVAGGCARGTIDCLRVKSTATAYNAFVAHYGAPNIISNGHGTPVVIVDGAPQKSFLVCTTCHTPHAMYTYKANADAPIAGDTSSIFPTYFFIAAPYNPGSNPGVSQASSATQFCRQCHFTGAGGSNEGNGIMGVTTAF